MQKLGHGEGNMFEEQNLPDSKVSIFHLHQVDPRLRTEKGLRDKVAVSLPLGSRGVCVVETERVEVVDGLED